MFRYYESGYEHQFSEVSRDYVLSQLRSARAAYSPERYAMMLRAGVWCRLAHFPRRLP